MKQSNLAPNKNTFLLTGCILFSLFVHVLCIFYLHNHSFIFTSNKKLFFTDNNKKLFPLNFTHLDQEKGNVLFRRGMSGAGFMGGSSELILRKAEPQKEKAPQVLPWFRQQLLFSTLHVNCEKKSSELSKYSSPKAPSTLAEAPKELPLQVPDFQFQPSGSQNLLAELLKSTEKLAQFNLPASTPDLTLKANMPITTSRLIFDNFITLALVDPIPCQTDITHDKSSANDDNRLAKTLEKIKPLDGKAVQVPSIFLAPKVSIPSLKELHTISYDKGFDIDVIYCKKSSNEEGYLFAITLIPKKEYSFLPLTKNVCFLIDKSNSIQNSRLTATRQAIASALPLLSKGDTFNIIAYHSGLDALSAQSLPATKDNIRRAKDFLFQQTLGNFLSTAHMLAPFKRLFANHKKNEQSVNIAILLTNCEDANKSANYNTLQGWTRANAGEFALYTLAISRDRNLPMMDLFSSLNKGQLSFSPTPGGLGRKLQRLVSDLKSPIAKDVSATAASEDPEVKIQFFPALLPNIFQNQPFVLLGSVNKLSNFTLFVQGKTGKECFQVKKTISFADAKETASKLEEEAQILEAYKHYHNFLYKKDKAAYTKAKQMLDNLNIQVTQR